MKSGTWLVIGVLAILGLGGFFLAQQQRGPEKGAMTGEEVLMPQDEANVMMDEDMAKEEGMMGEEMEKDAMDDKMMAEEVKDFTLENEGLSYTVKEMRVKKGDTVRVTFKVIQGSHDWRLDEFGATTQIMTAGDEETIEFVADKVGEFEYYCSVPGHREAGMVGTFIVEE